MVFLFENGKIDTIAILSGIILLIYFLLQRTYSYWNRKDIQTLPEVHYLFGHFKRLILQKLSFGQLLKELYERTDEPFVGIYGILRPKLLICDPELIKKILIQDFSHFTDRGINSNEDYDPFSATLFALPGERWRNMRSRLSPAFSSGKLKAMFPTIVNCCSTLESYLNKLTEDGHSVLDVCEMSVRLTINVIASFAFGIEVDSINEPNNDFRFYGCKVVEFNFWKGFKLAILMVQPKLLSLFRIKTVDIDLEKFIKSTIKKNIEYREQNNVSRRDFFQLLIQLRNTGTIQSDNNWQAVAKVDENQHKLTPNEISAQVYFFYLAGFETTATTISYCMFELAKNQVIQKNVHEEIDNVLSKYNGEISSESIADMKYLDACIYGEICFFLST